MTNPSKAEHYFSALAFASKVYSVLVEVNGVEVKGPVGELALPPGASLEWTFIPIRSGEWRRGGGQPALQKCSLALRQAPISSSALLTATWRRAWWAL